MTHALMSLAGGKVAVCLEGGCNPKATARSAVAVAETLMGYPPERIHIPQAMKEARRILHHQRVPAREQQSMQAIQRFAQRDGYRHRVGRYTRSSDA
jgi:acetoin utilization deacetylase AcuC-like enzyme